MANWRKTCLNTALLRLFGTMIISGCAGGGQTLPETGGQTLSQEVTTEYLLTTAGFKRLEVNDETPKRQALLNNLPPGKISTYIRNSEVYHAYPDEGSNTLYIGNEAAYQKYLSLARGRKMCERVTGANQEKFWMCMQEDQQAGRGQPKK